MIIYDSAQGRRSAILQILKDDSSVNVTELSKRFGVSEVTIRKDLRILKERKLLVRVHGGAILGASSLNDEVEERHVNFKKLVNAREKEAIGRAAAAHIKNGDTILVDSGTTAQEVVRNLHRFDDLTIITNSVGAMMEALKYKRFKVILLGGSVRENSLSDRGDPDSVGTAGNEYRQYTESAQEYGQYSPQSQESSQSESKSLRQVIHRRIEFHLIRGLGFRPRFILNARADIPDHFPDTPGSGIAFAHMPFIKGGVIRPHLPLVFFLSSHHRA